MSNILYKDERIEDKRGRRLYLRTKHNRRSSLVVMTIRNQRNGKGAVFARVQGVIGDVGSLEALVRRLEKKFGRFWFILRLSVDEAFPRDKG